MTRERREASCGHEADLKRGLLAVKKAMKSPASVDAADSLLDELDRLFESLVELGDTFNERVIAAIACVLATVFRWLNALRAKARVTLPRIFERDYSAALERLEKVIAANIAEIRRLRRKNKTGR